MSTDDKTHIDVKQTIGEVKGGTVAGALVQHADQVVVQPAAPAPDLDELRSHYLAYLRQRYAYLDLGGIAPKVANRTVKLAMADIYVPVQARREWDTRARLQHALDALQRAFPAGGQGAGTFPAPRQLALLTEALRQDGWDLPAELLAEQWISSHGDVAQLRQLLAQRAPSGQETPASVRELLACPQAVLLGHPGTGKSTTLRYITYAVAAGLGNLVGDDALTRLPILVRLVDYAAAAKEPNLSLRDYVRDRHDPDRAALFRHVLQQGECLVLLDGLDEVIDPRQRADIADQVEALVADCPGNRFLVASRIVGYEAGRLTGDFAHFTIGSLPEEGIRGFVQKWYEAIEQEGGGQLADETRARAEELCRAIQDRPGIRRLAENPLLLTIIALVNWRGGRLPNRRIEVYRHAAETLVESWPRVRRGVEFNAEEVLSLLQPVAYTIFATRSTEEIPEGELLPLLARAASETKPGLSEAGALAYVAELLPRLSEHSGLFLVRGLDVQTGQRVFGFLHLTFAEYLAARHLARQWEAEKDDDRRRSLLARYTCAPRWREVLLLMVAHAGRDAAVVPATQLLADILQIEDPYEQQLHQNLLLGAQCLADGLRVEAYASAHVLDRLAELILSTPVVPLREQSAIVARQMEGTPYEGALVGRLLPRLGDASEEVRASAASALGEIGSERAVDGLLRLLSDESEWVRLRAAEALGAIKSEGAVDGLLRLLSDASEEVGARAAGALGQIKGEQAVDGLLARLGDPSAPVRGRAAGALGQIKGERAVDGLLARLGDAREDARARVAGALGQIKRERAVDGLLCLLSDESEEVRGVAAWALGEIRSELAVDGLLRLLSDARELVRARATEALGEIRSERAVDGLLARLGDASARVRGRAASALGLIGSERAVDGLLARLGDASEGVRARAAWALGLIASERAVDGLLARLGDPSEDVGGRAAWALAEIKGERALDGLLARLGDSSAQVRARAAGALGDIKSERALDGLLARLADEKARVRGTAAWALGAIGSERAVDDLLVRLGDESQEARGNAAWALGKIKSERAVDGLLALLSDASEGVRGSAAEALGAIGSERAVDGLVARLGDKSEQVQARAARALRAIGSERAIPALFLLLTDTTRSYWWGGAPCDSAYTTLLEILALHAPDPGQSAAAAPARVRGPWDPA